jgi:hypothetical protein
MATVPTYNGPRVRDEALQFVAQREVDVSSNLKRTGQALVQTTLDVTERVIERDAQTQAFEVENKLTQEWLAWDGQARAHYRGEKVDGYMPAAQDWWKKASETYGKDLTPRAKQLIGRSLMSRQLSAIQSVGNFSNAEKERHADEVYNADINTTIQFGVTTGNMASTAQQIREKAQATGARKGWTAEQVQSEVTTRLSGMHLAYITTLASQDATAAQVYYDQAKARNEIDATAQGRIEPILKGEADNQFATQFAAGVAALPLKEQLAKAGEITDPERREKALAQVKNNHTLVRQAEAEEQNRYADEAWQLFSQGRAVPEATLAGMAGRDRAQLREAQRVRAERLVEGRTVKTDPAKLAELYDMARDDPEGFKRMKLGTLTERVSASDISTLGRLQRDMIQPDKEQGAITTMQAIGTYTRDMSKSDAALFQSAALTAIDRFQIDKKRPPTIEERRKLLDDLAVEGVIEREYWFDSKMRRFEMTPEEQARAKFPEQSQQDKFTVGQVYRDAKGNRAKYLGNGKWEPAK